MEVVGRKMYRMTLSLKPANRENPANPNTHAALAIESIAIHESEFIGRASPTVIAFNPWMNAIIGGRGIGKSTTVDMCRNTLAGKAISMFTNAVKHGRCGISSRAA